MKPPISVPHFAAWSLVFIISACATQGSAPIDQTNYRSNLRIERPDKTFYSAEYIGPERGCFPPITNSICESDRRGQPMYKERAVLEMEEFRIALTSSGITNRKLLDDMIFFTAADLAKERGYPFMTRLNSNSADVCGSIYSADTYGTINSESGTYSGSTVLNKDVRCASTQSGAFIFFRNRQELENGVFYRYNSGPFKTDALRPAQELYVGTTPNVKFEDYTIINVKNGTAQIGTSSAWKVTYDTAGLSNDLRSKYKISSTQPYAIGDARLENAEASKDPLIRNRLP